MTDKQKIDLANCQPNSHRHKDERVKNEKRKKIDPVIKKEKIVSTKKTVGRKVMEALVEEDVDDIKSYFIYDKLIPGVKNGILDLIETTLFGTSSRSRGGNSYRTGNTPYGSYYRSEGRKRDSYSRNKKERYEERHYESRNDRIDYRNIVLRNRGDAEEIIDNMVERIDEFGACSVADFMEMLDLSSNYVDNNWGWTDKVDIRLRRVSSGYLIVVPDAIYLD